jgi:isopentenyldiphosphate isomerase
MELIRVLNKYDGSPTGQTLPRNLVISQRQWCGTTNIYILNSKGEVLCHKRSAKKDRLPGVWMTHFGGHVGSEETYEENAKRELMEELGFHNPPQLIPWKNTKVEHSCLWVKEFVAFGDYEIAKLNPQPGEVDELRWLSPDEINRQSGLDPHAWVAGTHDFTSEYQCMRAALVAATHKGTIYIPQSLQSW